MNCYQRRAMACLGLICVLALFAPAAQAQITGVVSSDVEAFFGSQSDTVQQAEPPLGPGWPVNPIGPYGVPGPNVPALYAGYPNPSLTYAANIPYDTGHIGPGFADNQLTTANYSIIGNYSGGTFSADAYAQTWSQPLSLGQPTGATGFAYEKAEFVMTYSVGPLGIASGLAPAYPFQVSGFTVPGGYAEFGAQVDYWWQPVIPGTILPAGPAVNLGTLTYNFFQLGGGTFNTTVNHPNTTISGATGVGFLQLVGHMFVAGDPFSINVVSVPEPSTFVIGALGLAALGFVARRKHLRQA